MRVLRLPYVPLPLRRCLLRLTSRPPPRRDMKVNPIRDHDFRRQWSAEWVLAERERNGGAR